jgi:hypothetical protein
MSRGALACVVPLLLFSADDPVILTANDIADGFYDEVPSHVLGRADWLALYVSDSRSRLAATPVEFAQVGDAGYPEFEIVTDSPDPVLLFAGVPGLTPGDVVTVTRWPSTLSAEEPVALFEFGARDYSVRLSASDVSLCDASIALVFGNRVQTLYTPADNPFACDEPHFDVEWAGDLDRDGALDLLVTFSSKYSHYPRKLFLSSTAGPTDLVGEPISYEKTAS